MPCFLQHTKRKILFNSMKGYVFFWFLTGFLCCALPQVIKAEGPAPQIIRDAEIETVLHAWAVPVQKAAGIGNFDIVLVQSPQINAFVAGGKNIFIYTGLIDKTDGPDEILGVMAHEMGHIAGGHLISNRSAMERASYESILAAVLGIGAAVVTGEGQAAQAIILGGNSMAERGFLAHSRVNEASADQAAFRFLEGAHLSAKGLATFLEKLESEEILPSTQQSEYMRTHPITRNRVSAVETLVGSSAFSGASLSPAWKEQHARIKAKLTGFLAPQQVAWTYDERDDSVAACYARAIAAYRLSDVESALRQAESLIKREPQNPYFQELKGQMLVEFGRVLEAIPYYKKSVGLSPDSALLRIALAHALIEGNGPKNQLEEAIPHLKRALQAEPRAPRVHRLLATAYGRLGQEQMARLELAEEAVLQMKIEYAKDQAGNILKQAKQGGPEWVKARDILSQIAILERDKN